MSKEIYDTNGTRVREMYSTGSGLEVYVWDGSGVRIWPDAQPSPGVTLNMNWPNGTSTENTSGLPTFDTASSQFTDQEGLFRIEWYDTLYGISNVWATMTWTSYAGTNTAVENWGLNQDYPMQNVASVSWDENSGNTATMNLKWYNLEPADGTSQSWRRSSNATGFMEDPDYVAPQAPYQSPANITWYGERLALGEVTSTISKVTSTYVYAAGEENIWDFNAPTAAGSALRVENSSDRVRIERSIVDYSESAYDYVRRTGRHIVTIERNDYDPGTEYIIAGVDNASSTITNSYYVYPPTPSKSSVSATDIPLVQYSDNPADQDSQTVVTGESVTYRIYEDII